MSKEFQVGDFVKNLHSFKLGKVIEVNNRWGWLKVEYPTRIREYRLNSKEGCQQLRRLSKEEVVDYLYKLENAGITDSWYEM